MLDTIRKGKSQNKFSFAYDVHDTPWVKRIFQYCESIFTANDQLWYNCVSVCRNGANAILGLTEYVEHHTACEVRTLHD